ncbi:hypothetical protein [Falsiroseomonas oryzae]|uniref:hypothetical protein n=1 Tax=Falsiroseomonas oryzae TaxID=2766473 RepID=UPI0022EB24B0|nr:hypothetical protein [Roseomonas sp. MO-31]
MALPVDRPLLTTDVVPALGLDRPVKERLHSTLEAAWLLGLDGGGWAAVQNDTSDGPPSLLGPSQAILLRWLERWPHAVLRRMGVASPRELYLQLQEAGCVISRRNYGLALGCDGSAGSRWLNSSDESASPIVRRICAFVSGEGDPTQMTARWSDIYKCAETEAIARRGCGLKSLRSWYAEHEAVVPRQKGCAGLRWAQQVEAADHS